jgi:glutathione synthase/RimK-type ligase-like ATP-grasp enzyme
MSRRALGIYREPEFSPGKVEADAAILDAVLVDLAGEGIETAAIDAAAFADGAPLPHADIVLAMCQSGPALERLAGAEHAGAIAINPALAIRNCYRDLLAAGLKRAGVPAPPGGLVATSEKLDPRKLPGIDLGSPIFVKRGDLHALGSDDVRRASGRVEIDRVLADFAGRAIRFAYLQQEAVGRVVKFYGVTGTDWFAAVPDGQEMAGTAVRALSQAANAAAEALGLEAWGGDAVLNGERFVIIDFNDWPSFGKVRSAAAHVIARRAIALLARQR